MTFPPGDLFLYLSIDRRCSSIYGDISIEVIRAPSGSHPPASHSPRPRQAGLPPSHVCCLTRLLSCNLYPCPPHHLSRPHGDLHRLLPTSTRSRYDFPPNSEPSPTSESPPISPFTWGLDAFRLYSVSRDQSLFELPGAEHVGNATLKFIWYTRDAYAVLA